MRPLSLALLLLATPALASEWSYTSAARRDPFAPLQPTIPCGPILTGIQAFDPGRFVVQGVLLADGDPRALLVDPEGKAWSVRMGSYVGSNWGRVTAITDGGVTIREEFRTVDDQLVVNDVKLPFGG